MNSHQWRLVRIDLPSHQRQVMHAVESRAVKVKIKVPVVGRQFNDLLELNQFFPLAAISDEALDRTDSQAVFAAELHQFGQPGHGSVVVQNFAEYTRWLKSGKSGEVYCRLGVSGATQHPAVFCAKRKHVTGLNQVFR